MMRFAGFVKIAFLILLLANLPSNSTIVVDSSAIERYGCPRLDEIYMKIISYPDTQVSAFQACEVDFIPDMIRWYNIDKLLGKNQTIIASPGFHFCYLAFNCRSYVPNDAGQPDAGRELAPLNWTSFRQALAWVGLSHAEKEAAIPEMLLGPIYTTVDSPVPSSLGVWHEDPPQYPGCNYSYAWELLQADGFYVENATLMQPNGVPARNQIEIIGGNGAPNFLIFILEFVDKWNDFFDNYVGVTNCNFHAQYTAFNIVFERAFYYRNFDCHFMCIGLDRYPAHLYDLFHSSQDFPWGYNSAGINDSQLDSLLETIRYGLVYEEKFEACYEVQEKLVFDLVPCVYCYGRVYHHAFKNYTYYTGEQKWLTGFVNMKGYGADNPWTWGLMHWNTAPTGGSVNYVLGYYPESLHPGWAQYYYDWDVLNRVEDGLLRLSPELEDVPWIACNWTLEPFIFEPLGVNGSKFRFHIMDGVKWHDGKSVTVEDIEFALNYSRNFPRLESVWQSVLWSQIVDPTTIDIYLNTTASNAYWLQDDLAAIATMFPKHIYEKAGSTTAKLWEISYQSWTGKPPPAEYPFMKALIGCGPYVFDYWNKTSGIVHLVKFQNYWIDGPLKLEITAPTQVDPDTAFEYTVDILNAGSINSETDEFATAIIDYIEIYEDDNLINVLAGPFAVEPFSHLKLEPCTNTRLNKGLHTLSFKLYAYGELYDQYTHLVYSTIKEDINSDFYVGVDDVFAVASAFGSQPPPFSGCERWNEHCDVNEDYYVGIDDIFQIASSFSWDP